VQRWAAVRGHHLRKRRKWNNLNGSDLKHYVKQKNDALRSTERLKRNAKRCAREFAIR